MSAEIIAIIIMSVTIIGIQMTTFIYLLRRMDTRMDALQNDIGEARKEIGKLAERVARLEGILIGRQQVRERHIHAASRGRLANSVSSYFTPFLRHAHDRL